MFESGGEILPERKAQLATGFLKTDKGIASPPAQVMPSGATNLASGNDRADIGFSGIGMQGQGRHL